LGREAFGVGGVRGLGGEAWGDFALDDAVGWSLKVRVAEEKAELQGNRR